MPIGHRPEPAPTDFETLTESAWFGATADGFVVSNMYPLGSGVGSAVSPSTRIRIGQLNPKVAFRHSEMALKVASRVASWPSGTSTLAVAPGMSTAVVDVVENPGSAVEEATAVST